MSSTSSRTPLMEACWRGDIAEVERLIREGADVNAGNSNGTTPLMYAKTHAFSTGETRLIRLLLASGADPSRRDKAGKTAADYTRERCRLVLQLLRNEPSQADSV
ncbi:ankyrin repeat domain-containing protein [Nitrobacter winogradskyi]|uniref:Ankyrin repeat protein n=2 Tax=Nitrobacter winogradskyi TaxID=913 RepID=A0ACC6AD31_NITWI|nr:ankyrin repeat domain-containing protein [Nitrobacter winogradskyi]MCP1997699.1 ankyrin repeat protein [Nitrobacter winogradskyi]